MTACCPASLRGPDGPQTLRLSAPPQGGWICSETVAGFGPRQWLDLLRDDGWIWSEKRKTARFIALFRFLEQWIQRKRKLGGDGIGTRWGHDAEWVQSPGISGPIRPSPRAREAQARGRASGRLHYLCEFTRLPCPPSYFSPPCNPRGPVSPRRSSAFPGRGSNGSTAGSTRAREGSIRDF